MVSVSQCLSFFLDFQAIFGPLFLFLIPFNEFPRVTNKIFNENAAAE